ncbi:hypothetical protein [Brunnivagina elsteri]|uniref:hypothetical protein n=1 Tax=Brunnivagina elsteri TaxID=1247191 RepID=UPI002694E773
MEERFRKKFPDLRILRIDSESVSDPSHPAFGCIVHLNEILTKYDLVIASPSLETGVSIDIKGHFNAVWGIFQGVQSANSVRQMLARLRETVDRHIWVRGSGMGWVEDGYRVIDAEDIKEEESQGVFESVKAASQELYGEECKAIRLWR